VILSSSLHTIFSANFVESGNWVDNMANFIVNPVVALILTCIIFIGFLYQLYSNKINIIGIVATLTLLIFFLGFYIKGDVNLYSVILFGIGVIFVIIELFVVGAVIGIIGMALIVFSIITLGDNLVYMIANVVVALILSIIEWVILVKIFKRKIPFLDKVVLKDSTNAEAGYTSHEDRSHLVGQTAYWMEVLIFNVCSFNELDNYIIIKNHITKSNFYDMFIVRLKNKG